MGSSRAEVAKLVNELERALRRLEAEAKVKGLQLKIKAIAPNGPKIDSEVTFTPEFRDQEIARRATDDVKRIVADFENDSDHWVDLIEAEWSRPPGSQRHFPTVRLRARY